MALRKTLVYLDQNYISNIAKALYLKGWKDPSATYYRDLHGLLWSLTIDGKLLVPVSPFTEQEAAYGARVKDIVWHVSRRLSCETSFRHWTALHFWELEAAATAYASGTSSPGLLVSQVFDLDPQRELSEEELTPQLMVNIPLSEEFQDWGTSMNSASSSQYASYKAGRVSEQLSFVDEVEVQKRTIVEETFFSMETAILSLPEKDRELASIAAIDTVARLRSVCEIATSTGKRLVDFLSSDALISSNIIEIEAQLRASDTVFHPDEEQSPSFQTDLNIIATVLPYVDIVATDAGIKERHRKTALPDKYGAKIFSNVKKDRSALIERLRSL